MSLFYNLIFKKNPMRPQDDAKLYLSLKGTGLIRQKVLSRAIAKRLNIFPSLCTSVIECWCEVALEKLLLGKSVEFGPLGYITLRASSEGAPSEEEATAKMLKNIHARFYFSKEAKEELQNADLISMDTMTSGIFKREKPDEEENG